MSTPQTGAVASRRSVEIAVSLVLLAFASLMAFDNWRTGMGWAPEGPQAGYFPFYLSLVLGSASLYGLASALREGAAAAEPFLEREQAQRLLRVLVPIVLFCALVQVLGLYVASFSLVTGFMRAIGGIAWWKSLLTALAFTLALFATFDVAFDVIMPKGPLEALLGR